MLAREVDEFTQFQRQLDDITAIVIKVDPAVSPAPGRA
jgi:hypothetical protein